MIGPASKMVVMRKRKADEVVTLSADVEEWIKTELWEEKAREVVKEEREEEEEMEEEEAEESKKSFHVDSLLLSRSQKFLRRGGESGQRV